MFFKRRRGIDPRTAEDRPRVFREADIEMIDNESTHVIALVDAPSLGVGMELERALTKHRRGLPLTPVLALVHEYNLERLSFMVQGVREPHFSLQAYIGFDDITVKIEDFMREFNASKREELTRLLS